MRRAGVLLHVLWFSTREPLFGVETSKVLFSTQSLLENKHTCVVLTEGTPETPGVGPLLLTPRAVPGGRGDPGGAASVDLRAQVPARKPLL